MVTIIPKGAAKSGAVADNRLRTHKARTAAFSISRINNRWYIMSCLSGAYDVMFLRLWPCLNRRNWHKFWQCCTKTNTTTEINMLERDCRERTRTARKEVSFWKPLLYLICVYVFVFAENVACGNFWYQILLVQESQWALQQTVGVLVTEWEGAVAPH